MATKRKVAVDMYRKSDKELLARYIASMNEDIVGDWQRVAELTAKLNELTTNGDGTSLSEYLLELTKCSGHMQKAWICLDRALKKLQRAKAKAVTHPK